MKKIPLAKAINSLKRRMLLPGILATAAFLAVSAEASTIQVVWTGTILNGNDIVNTFGLGTNHDLTGQAFSATYLIDTTLPSFMQFSPGFASLTGGTDVVGFTNPITSATLTINSQTFSFLLGAFGGYTRDATPGRSNIYTEIQNQEGPGRDILFLTDFLFDNSIPFTGLNETLSIAVGAGGRGVFQALTPIGDGLFSGNFTPTHVDISTVGAAGVPEPATGLLVAASVSLCVFARRRLKKASA